MTATFAHQAARTICIRTARAPRINPEHYSAGHKPKKATVLLNVTAPSTALSQTKTGNFSYHGEGYKYTLKADKSKLMLQCKREVWEKFRTSQVGRKAMELVDAFHQGAGWYEVTSQDFSNFSDVDNVRRNGLIVWLRIFNQFCSNPVEVHVIADPVNSVETPPAYVDEALLAERDAHVERVSLRLKFKKADHIVKVVPKQAPQVILTPQKEIKVVQPKVSASKLAALAAAFKKH